MYDPIQPKRHESNELGSLSELAAIQPGVPGAELVSLTDLAVNQNGTKWNSGAAFSSPILPADSGDSATSTPGATTPDEAAAPSLSVRQRAALAKLVCGRSPGAAASELGIGRTTLYRWRQDPAFAKELNRLSLDAVQTTVTRARNLMLQATRVLADSLNERDRFNWAMKMVNSNRLWLMGQKGLVEDDASEISAQSFVG